MAEQIIGTENSGRFVKSREKIHFEGVLLSRKFPLRITTPFRFTPERKGCCLF